MIRPVITAAALLLGACGLDHSITHGADGKPEWDRRLHAAVPLGIEEAAARSLLKRNGFRCEPRPTGLSCDKWSHRAVVRRHWMAVLQVREGRVTEVRSSTTLIRP